jgi:hypothetical protein
MKGKGRRVSLSFCGVIFCLFVVGCGGGSQGGSTTQQNPPPTLTSMSPTGATAGAAALTLTLTGTSLISSSQVEWNGTALATNYVSGTSLTAQVPASDLTTAGTASVTVVNPAPGGGTSAALSFTINGASNPAPTLTSISPTSATAGAAALTLTATGTGFITGSQVEWNGAALATTYVSGTSLTAHVPASDLTTAGTASVTVVNPAPGGGTSAVLSFTINVALNPAPTLTSISPTSATAGAAVLTLTVAGTGFISSSQVEWNGAALATTYVSGTSLTAQVPAADLTTAGTASVTVVNPAPGGGTSAVLSFTINVALNPAPTLTSISPTSATAGAAVLTLTVTGTGFISSSQVEWNGAALATTYVSGTSLTAQVPAADLTTSGTASVTVVNPAPGGGTSAAESFTIASSLNPVPTLSTLSPAGAAPGAVPMTLTVTGTNFVDTSEVLWNGAALVTSYVSSTTLTAQIPATDLTSTGTATVTVMNPTPGGGTSGSLTFTINLTGATLNVLSVEGNDLAWDATHGKLYVAVPSTASTNPSTITVVDPVAGTIGTSQSLSSAPTKLAISSDDTYLYALINSAETIQRVNLPGLTTDIQWSLGTNSLFSEPYVATDMQVEPSGAHTLAVAEAVTLYGFNAVSIYDDGVARSESPSGGGFDYGPVQWKADGSELFVGGDDSDSQIYVFSVTANGASSLATYGADGGSSLHLHSDPATGYLYNDSGYVLNPADGVPVGNYSYGPSNLIIGNGSMVAVDPAVGRVFVLREVYESGGSEAFEIQSFDQATFRPLSTLAIPNAAGIINNFIPWGQSGLAFVTTPDYNGAGGQLYILDGTFVNPSGVLDTTAGSAITPVPTLSSMSPLTATAGSGDTTLTIMGRDFLGTPTVYWNGNPLVTTTVNTTEVQATIPGGDLATATQAAITVANGATAVPGSSTLYFGVNPAPPAGTQVAVYPTGGNDLKWDANAGLLYVSMPGIQGTEGDSIAMVDPASGSVTQTGFLGSEPDQLAVSSDGSYLYLGLDGQNSIEQLTLPSFTVNNAWNLGANSFSGPYYALDIEAAPGAPQTTAVILANFYISPSAASVQIYDNGMARGSGLAATNYQYEWLQWAEDDTTLYSVDQSEPQSFLILGVGSSGATLTQPYSGILNGYSPTIHYDAGTGMVYTDAGQVVNPTNGTVVNSYGASGIAVPDSSLDRVFILGQTTAQSGTQNYTIESFDQAKGTEVGSITIDNVVGTPTALVRWGSSGLAFTTNVQTFPEPFAVGPGQLYVISGGFVTAAARTGGAAPVAPVHRTWQGPAAARQGTVAGAGTP